MLIEKSTSKLTALIRFLIHRGTTISSHPNVAQITWPLLRIFWKEK